LAGDKILTRLLLRSNIYDLQNGGPGFYRTRLPGTAAAWLCKGAFSCAIFYHNPLPERINFLELTLEWRTSQTEV